MNTSSGEMTQPKNHIKSAIMAAPSNMEDGMAIANAIANGDIFGGSGGRVGCGMGGGGRRRRGIERVS